VVHRNQVVCTNQAVYINQWNSPVRLSRLFGIVLVFR
jgi:hypothetical protein